MESMGFASTVWLLYNLISRGYNKMWSKYLTLMYQ